MENSLLVSPQTKKKILNRLALFCLLFVFPYIVYSYSPYYTHPDLTEQMALLFNNKYAATGVQFSKQQIQWLREGAMEEDEPPRWINHFYDPVHNKAWDGNHAGYLDRLHGYLQGRDMAPMDSLTSVDWVSNQEAQSMYRQFGNQTWQKAIWSYLHGDQEGAFVALGHILHLVEDASVPDHTRDDTHAHWANDPGSPFEDYAEQYTNTNPLTYSTSLVSSSVPVFSSIQSAIVNLAQFSNHNFFSEDTIFVDFDSPTTTDKNIVEKNGYVYDQQDDIYLARIIHKAGRADQYTTNDQSFVLPSYRDHLFPKAILTGVGVMKLFFSEVEKEAGDQNLIQPLIDKNAPTWWSLFKQNPTAAFKLTAVTIYQNVWERAQSDYEIYDDTANKNLAYSQESTVWLTSMATEAPVVISLPLIFTPTPGSLTSPISIAGVLKIPLQELQNILSRAPESTYFGYLGTQNNPAVFVNSENDPIYALLKPYLTTTNNDATSLALKQVANAVVDLNNKTNKITTDSDLVKQKALKEVKAVVTSTVTVPLDWLTNYYKQIESMLPGYGQQFTTEAECKAAGWEWDDRYNRGFVINYGQTATPYGNTVGMLNLIPGGYYVQFNNSDRVYQKQGSLWVPIIGYAGSDYVKIPTPPSATNLLPDDYGIYVNNLKPVTLYSPYYLGGINYYQNKTTGQLYRDPDGQNPVDAAQVSGLASAGYRPTDGLSYTQAMNSTGAVNPLIQGGGSVVTGNAASTYLANQSGNIYSNQICLAPQTTKQPLGLLDQAMSFISNAYNTVKNTVSLIIDSVMPIVNNITKAVTKAVKTAATVISNAVSAIVSKAQAAANSVVQFSSQVNNFLQNTVASVAPKVAYVYNNVVAGVKTFLGVLGF